MSSAAISNISPVDEHQQPQPILFKDPEKAAEANNMATRKTSNNTLCQSTTNSSKIEIPDGGYGWVVVAASFWLNACAWG